MLQIHIYYIRYLYNNEDHLTNPKMYFENIA
jgi:hypothetical protein